MVQKKITRDEAIQCIRKLISYIGDNPNREGLLETPERVIRSYEEIFSGYKMNEKEVLSKRFKTSSSEMIILSDIEIYSTCEHHMLPFTGKCHIGYIPKSEVIGISKLARIMEVFSRRLQIQEELCFQIAHAINSELSPYGVGVVIEAQHMCMTCRGVEKQNSVMTSSSLCGSFRTDLATRQEFFKLIRK